MGEQTEDVQRGVAGGDSPPRLADDQFYRALASTHRRRLLYYLLETTESTVEELASVLGGWEVTTGGTMQTPADRSELRLELMHVHLPRLADAGLIAYDPDEGTVELEPLHPRVADLVRGSIESGPLEAD